MPYIVDCIDSDLYFYREIESVLRCSVCGELLNKWGEDLASVRLKKKPKYDLSCSYDGVMVASKKFKHIYELYKMEGLEFNSLDGEYFWIMPNTTVPFDAKTRGTRFENYCSVCDHFESVIGADPVVLVEPYAIKELGFTRTDLEFGSADEKSPVFICGDGAGEILNQAKLTGLEVYVIGSEDP